MSSPLDELDRKLKAAQARQAAENKADDGDGAQGKGLGMALRFGIEMVAGLAVGVGVGLLIDHQFDTAPWGLIIMFFLGAGAGVMNVYRSAMGFGMAIGYKEQEDKSKDVIPEEEDQGGEPPASV